MIIPNTKESRPPASASLGRRYRAYVSDGPFLAPIQMAGVLVTSFLLDLDVWAPIFVLFATWIAYLGLFWAFWDGQTPGMRSVGIRVVRQDGSALGVRSALVRAASLTIGLLGGVVPLSILLSEDGRGIHDHIAGTRVVEVLGPMARVEAQRVDR